MLLPPLSLLYLLKSCLHQEPSHLPQRMKSNCNPTAGHLASELAMWVSLSPTKLHTAEQHMGLFVCFNQNLSLALCQAQRERSTICCIKLAMEQKICSLFSLIFLSNKNISPAGRLFCENKLECLLLKAKLIWGLLCQSCLSHLFGNANVFRSGLTCQIN